jgi:hypothetical protein
MRFCALLLGRLRMSVDDAVKALARIGAAVFPHEANEIATPDVNMTTLREAIEAMLQDHGHTVDIKLNDEILRDPKCKV